MIRPEPKKLPRVVATPDGSFVTLANSGNLAADLQDALSVAHSNKPCALSVEELDRCIQEERIRRGLQAEAGVGGAFVLLLHTRSEKLATGARLLCFLTFSQTIAGDAVYWNVMFRDVLKPPTSLVFALWEHADTLLQMLRSAAGGSSEVSEYGIEVPSEEDLRRMDA